MPQSHIQKLWLWNLWCWLPGRNFPASLFQQNWPLCGKILIITCVHAYCKWIKKCRVCSPWLWHGANLRATDEDWWPCSHVEWHKLAGSILEPISIRSHLSQKWGLWIPSPSLQDQFWMQHKVEDSASCSHMPIGKAWVVHLVILAWTRKYDYHSVYELLSLPWSQFPCLCLCPDPCLVNILMPQCFPSLEIQPLLRTESSIPG